GEDLGGVAGVEDRPHRRSELVGVPETVIAVPEVLLRALVEANNTAVPDVKVATGDEDNGRFDCTPAGVRAWLESRGVQVKGEKRNGDKTLLLLECCPINSEIVSTGGSDIAVMVGDDGKLAYCNKHNRGENYTWHDLRRVLDPDYEPHPVGDVDLSSFRVSARGAPQQKTADTNPLDPGPLPQTLLRIPGFVGELMNFCLETAPYPNPVMAFGGALALQAFLAGRKVRDPGDNRTNIMQAPKVTLFNGQQAFVSDTTQMPFVISLIPVVGDFAAAHQPVIVVLSEGTFMTVQAVVSNDRRYVRLTIVPFFSKIGDVDTFTFASERVSSRTGGDDADPNTPPAPEDIIAATTVQLPSFSFVTVTTTVSVPDGGTVLLGGIKRLSEGRNELGVPMLNKIPYINRLFKNIGIGKSTQSLMMMVTPRIIIQEEEEEKLGIATP
ncbi:MAG: hypothetical protein IIA67_07820, partial [Planctomycetes bacterium]|nr:hypothetical protein [Planctomycetota bacterium]